MIPLSESDTILVAEGDALIRMVMTDMLGDAGFAVAATSTVPGALAQLEARPGTRALITGRTLSAVGDGIGLIHRARARWPGLALLITSGAASDLPDLIPADVRILWKPFHYQLLARAVADEIRRCGLAAAPVLPEGSPTGSVQLDLAAAAPARGPDMT